MDNHDIATLIADVTALQSQQSDFKAALDVLHARQSSLTENIKDMMKTLDLELWMRPKDPPLSENACFKELMARVGWLERIMMERER